ncbi:MAG: radical SAM protein [Candidatus Margulisbacteria bacterium]|nr:radical SAM protein [Candidatus Margulisiibacteriota bacterium]
MCYAIPAKLIEINGQKGVVDYFGEKRNILLDLDDLQIGDYVYAQGGILVRKVPEEEALGILKTWKEIFFELKKTDAALAQLDQKALPQNVLGILQQVNLRKTINKKDLLALFQMKKENELKVLYELANNVRQREHGNASCVHGIIEFSSCCNQNCFYCGIRKDKDIARFRMSIEEIIETARDAVEKYGFKALVLQSGEDYWYSDEKLEIVVSEIRKLGVLVFLSIGSRSKETYEKLYQAGARAALLRFETSNEKIFDQLRPGTKLVDRLDLIKHLRKIGYIIATGFILGLPGETEEDIVNNILQTKALGPDMYSFGPLIPTKGTPLVKADKVDKELVKKTIAISRLADPNSNILVTTALETLDKAVPKEALLAGGNSMMINVTPKEYQKLYAIYDNRAHVNQSIEKNVKEVVSLLFSLGRSPTDIGDVQSFIS